MFASTTPNKFLMFVRAASIAATMLAIASPAIAASGCKPIIGFRDVQFSPVQRETLERRWTARLWADASSCKSVSGRFEILFSRLKENAPELDFVEAFYWKQGSFEISVDFWQDEAVDGYWFNRIDSCPCRD
jgi:hypothetical protein